MIVKLLLTLLISAVGAIDNDDDSPPMVPSLPGQTYDDTWLDELVTSSLAPTNSSATTSSTNLSTSSSPTTSSTTTSPSTTTSSTTTPSTTTSSPTTTAPKLELRCDQGWTMYNRTPSAANGNTAHWCMRVTPASFNITIRVAAELCAVQGAVLTGVESKAEFDMVTAEAKVHINGKLKRVTGAIAIAGDRNPQCFTQNRTILSAPPCNDTTVLFSLPASAHTDAKFLWTIWAKGEPNTISPAPVIEECLQLMIWDNSRINDFYCDEPPFEVNLLFKNFGALCGKAPEMKSVSCEH